MASVTTDTLFPEDGNESEETQSDLLPSEEKGEKFLEACENGDADMVAKFLKSSKASVLNQTDSIGNTGLHRACWRLKQEIVKMIVAKKEANVNIKDNGGDNALWLCADNETMAKILLECGRLKIDEMNGIEHFTKNEDGSMEFRYYAREGKFQIKMNSSTSVKSIEKI